MGITRAPLPVQAVVGIIANPQEDLAEVRSAIVDLWGAADLSGPAWDFDFTEYYEREMGAGLVRQFVALERLRDVEGLHRMKLEANELERRLAAASRAGVARPVNIDPGYICHSKLVLFSTKDFSHRIYVGDGVYAEITLEWRGGAFREHAWTFPDYRTEKYRNFFTAARVNYMCKLDCARASASQPAATKPISGATGVDGASHEQDGYDA